MTRASKRCLAAAVGGLVTVSSAPPSHAATLAYLNFEDSPNPAGGTLVSANAAHPNPGGGTTPAAYTSDVSGRGNHFRGFDQNYSGAYSTVVPTAVVPGTGAANLFSLSPAQQLNAGFGGDIYSGGAPTLNAYDLNGGFSVEVSASANALGGFGNIVGKDGRPVATSPLAPLQLKLRGDTFGGTVNPFQIEIVDQAGAGHSVVTTFTPEANTFYDLAATYDPSLAADQLKLYAKASSEAGPYVLQGSATTPNIASDPTSPGYAIGRGFYNGGTTDNFNGLVDNVRISDTALLPTQFLGTAVPEPTSLGLIGLVGAGLLRRRRRA